jgi:hypothetical protein
MAAVPVTATGAAHSSAAQVASAGNGALYDADVDDDAETPELGLSSSQHPSTLFDADDDEFEGEEPSGVSRPPLPAAGMPPPAAGMPPPQPTSSAPPSSPPGEKASANADRESVDEPQPEQRDSGSFPPSRAPDADRAAARDRQETKPASARPSWRGVSNRPRRLKHDRSDEQTAPALRHIREINTTRAQALIVLSVALALSLVAIIVLLLRG